MIYFTSDLHFFHDREFIYLPRGFKSELEMREYYVKMWNDTVTNEDDVYMLGDFCLGQRFEDIKELITSLNGKIHLVIGNHDTDMKIKLYETLDNLVEIRDVIPRFKYDKFRFYLSHYPTITSNLESNISECVINLHGHIHSKVKFYEDRPYMLNISVDAQENKIVSIDYVIKQIQEKVKECMEFL